MYPYDRKMNLPGRGTVNFGIIKKELESGNLNSILKHDKPYKITIDFLNHCTDNRILRRSTKATFNDLCCR